MYLCHLLPGEAFQFDWGKNWVSIAGRKVKVQLAHFKLCHSKAGYQRAYWTQTHEMLFDADFCNPASGWEKGQVEKSVQDGRYALWHQAPAFASLDELNDWLERECLALWRAR